MNLKKLLLVYLTIIISRNTDTKGLEYNPLNDLIHKLLINKDYAILVRPTLNATSRLTRVETELKLLQIDLDEKYQELISTAWIEMIWFDNRLIWNPNDFDGIKEITLDINKIWVNHFYLIISVKLMNDLSRFTA